jgi:hypothetical protein
MIALTPWGGQAVTVETKAWKNLALSFTISIHIGYCMLKHESKMTAEAAD